MCNLCVLWLTRIDFLNLRPSAKFADEMGLVVKGDAGGKCPAL